MPIVRQNHLLTSRSATERHNFSNFHSGRRGNSGHSRSHRPFLLCGSFVAGLMQTIGLGSEEEFKEEGDPLVMTIKRGILCKNRGQHLEAETIFHAALKMAADLMNENAEEYIYVMLAENAVEQRDLDKAESLYKEVLKKILGRGRVTDDDEAVIDISLQLATIYTEKKDWEKAEEGYRFCIQRQKKRVEPILKSDPSIPLTEEQINSLALYAWILDWYSKYATIRGDINMCHKYLEESYAVSKRFLSSEDPQKAVLLSDLGVSYDRIGKLEEAIQFLKEATTIASKTDHEDTEVFFYNLGMLYLKKGEADNAIFCCQRSMKFCDDRGRMRTKLKAKARNCVYTAHQLEDELNKKASARVVQ